MVILEPDVRSRLDDQQTIHVERAVPMQHQSYEHDQLAGLKILLVEDDPTQRCLLFYLLFKAGADVTLENNGQGAVDLVTSHAPDNVPYDLLLIDINMPVLDGCAATKVLRDAGYEIPVIVISGLCATTWRPMCFNVGCDAYIAKPAEPTKLFEVLERFSPQRV